MFISLTASVFIGLALFADTLRWLYDSWLTDPNYSHGLLVPFIAAFFVWRARDAFRARQPSAHGLWLLGGALALHLWATPFRIYPLSALALVIMLTSCVVLVWGWAALRASQYAFIILALMIPLPFIDRLSPTLEAFTANIAASSVSLFGTPAVTMGSQVQLPAMSFEIGAACSGVRSLASLVTLAVVFSGLVEGPRWARRSSSSPPHPSPSSPTSCVSLRFYKSHNGSARARVSRIITITPALCCCSLRSLCLSRLRAQ